MTRRELRAAREAAEAASVPAVPVAPIDTGSTPTIIAAPAAAVVQSASVIHPAVPPVLPPSDDLHRPRREARQPHPERLAAPPAAGPASTGPAKKSKSRSLRERITATGTMLVVGGIFASLTLPAYAFEQPQDEAAKVFTAGDPQSLDVSDSVAAAVSARDVYGATSAADIRALYRNAAREQNLAAYMASGAQAAGDDYPWPDQLTRGQGGSLSPLRYYYRECVDFVAWRLNRDAGSYSAPFKWDWASLTPSGGNASQWKNSWAAKGWPMGTTPEVGSVAWFPYNHVAYVNAILADGSVLIEEYNQQSDHMYHQRVIAPGDAYYLYVPAG